MRPGSMVLRIEQGPRENIEDTGGGCGMWAHDGSATSFVMLDVDDGVGGHNFGELASRIAHEQITLFMAQMYLREAERRRISPETIVTWLSQSLEAAHQAITQEASRASDRRGMATTAVVAAVYDDKLHVAWVGDSRCYVYQAGTLERVTRDHSEAQDLIDAGVCSPEEAKSLPSAHVITRCLGQPAPLEVDCRVITLASDALIALVTDGLTDVISDDQLSIIIRSHLAGRTGLAAMADAMVNAALKSGTQDNATVLLFQRHPDQQAVARSERTQTGAYPVRRAQALHRLPKEKAHVSSIQPLLFD